MFVSPFKSPFQNPFPTEGAAAAVSYQSKVLGYSPISYFPLNEISGETAIDLADSNQNGTYVGPTLNNTTGPDGEPAPLFDGTNDRVTIYSDALRGAFSEDEGTMGLWVKPIVRDRYGITFRLGANTSYNMHFGGSNFSSGGLEWWQRRSSSIVYREVFETTTQWNFMMMEWSYSGGYAKCYRDGVFKTDLGSLTSWGANILSANFTALGWDGTGNYFYGYLAGAMIFSSPLGATIIADLAVAS